METVFDVNTCPDAKPAAAFSGPSSSGGAVRRAAQGRQTGLSHILQGRAAMRSLQVK
jgi:hypothetical protein